MLVHDVMTSEPATVTAAAHTKEAATVLAELHISVLPVVDEDDRICGVVSEADLIRDAFPPDASTHLFPRQRIHRTAVLVSEVMTSTAITVHESTDVADVAELMTSRNLKSVPVIDEDHRVVGVVSRSDLMRVRARGDDLVEQDVEALLASIGHRDWKVGGARRRRRHRRPEHHAGPVDRRGRGSDRHRRRGGRDPVTRGRRNFAPVTLAHRRRRRDRAVPSSDPDLLARIDLAPGSSAPDALETLDLIGQRRTDRRRFTSWPIPAGERLGRSPSSTATTRSRTSPRRSRVATSRSSATAR